MQLLRDISFSHVLSGKCLNLEEMRTQRLRRGELNSNDSKYGGSSPNYSALTLLLLFSAVNIYQRRNYLYFKLKLFNND